MTEQIACSTLRPTLRMLSDEQIRTIHNTSLDILSGTGIEMRHEGARRLLLDAGAVRCANAREVAAAADIKAVAGRQDCPTRSAGTRRSRTCRDCHART